MHLKKAEFLVETDVLLEYLTASPGAGTLLENLLERGICFTSVFNASELMFWASNTEEEQVVRSLLSGINILGLHPRYALTVAHLRGVTESPREAVIASLAINNRLPVATYSGKSYANAGITVITE